MSEDNAVYVGLDVGKSAYHACALTVDGSRLYDNPLVQDEAALRNAFVGLQQHGPVLMIVDQPNTIGALAIAVARNWTDRGERIDRRAAVAHPDRREARAGITASIVGLTGVVSLP